MSKWEQVVKHAVTLPDDPAEKARVWGWVAGKTRLTGSTEEHIFPQTDEHLVDLLIELAEGGDFPISIYTDVPDKRCFVEYCVISDTTEVVDD